jgi:hypothetical protein
MLGTIAGNPFGYDFAPFGDKPSESFYIFIVDAGYLINTKLAFFAFGKLFSSDIILSASRSLTIWTEGHVQNLLWDFRFGI